MKAMKNSSFLPLPHFLLSKSPFFYISSLLEKPIYLCFFFIAIGSRSLLRVFLSLNFMSHPLEKSLLNSKKTNPCISRKESHLFQKNSFIPILTLRKSSFLFQSLTNFKILFPLVGRFSYKNIKLLN